MSDGRRFVVVEGDGRPGLPACDHDVRASWRDWRADVAANRSAISTVALAVHRLGHALWTARQNGKNSAAAAVLWPVYKLVDLVLVKLVIGADLPASACIGGGLILDHGGKGVMLNEHLVIGTGVTIYHQVTIGWKEVRDRHLEHPVPVIGDHVVIGAGAKVLGGITVGDGAIIGANAVVLIDVPAGAVAAGVPATLVR